MTNEKSIMQNFKSCGNELDNLFSKDYLEELFYNYIQVYKNKIKNAMKKFNLEKIYYLAFITVKNNIYISLLKINVDNIDHTKIDNDKHNSKSINITNFIDKSYGNVKLYKSKKRLELRFNKNIIYDTFTIKLI